MGKKRSYGQHCTVARALDVVGSDGRSSWCASFRRDPSGSRIFWRGFRGSGRTSSLPG